MPGFWVTLVGGTVLFLGLALVVGIVLGFLSMFAKKPTSGNGSTGR